MEEKSRVLWPKSAARLAADDLTLPLYLSHTHTPPPCLIQQPMVQQVKAEKSERNELGTSAPYQRTIP